MVKMIAISSFCVGILVGTFLDVKPEVEKKIVIVCETPFTKPHLPPLFGDKAFKGLPLRMCPDLDKPGWSVLKKEGE